MVMPNDPIIASNGTFGDVYADLAQKELYCRVECPPVGKLRVRIRSDSFTFDVERSEKADGTLLLSLKDTFHNDKASQAAAMLHQLGPNWQALWPKIYKALLQLRSDYKCTAEITHENCA